MEAVDFMHANMHQPLTLSEVAEATGISVRSLQYGFRRFRDITPLAYLREIRLEVRFECRDPRLCPRRFDLFHNLLILGAQFL